MIRPLLGLLSLTLCALADDKDYRKELPRIPPLTPQKSLATFKLHPGLEIELVASEPLIRDPVAMAFDENGRLYVAEMPEYNQYANPAYKGHGCIKLLDDTNGDGRYDTSTVFHNLDTPTSIACWDGGIFVGSVPDILYLKDTDGDGKADVRKKVFTGFARDRAGEAMLNSFRWGLDNRFHVSTSLAGGLVSSAKQKKTQVRGRGFLFDPLSLRFELSSGGGQHGMSMDDWGRKLVCGNSEPVTFMMYDDRYLLRNPLLKAPKPAVNIAPGGKYTNVYRISRVEPWRILRTRLRAAGKVRGPKESGRPAGFFTGATGVTAYRGHAWPKEYHGNIFVGEVSGNLIYRAKLVPKGVGFTAVRVDPGNRKKEFLASTDNWFRPVQFAHGPDGNLYVLDMYRELIEGAAFLPPEILKHMDVSAGSKKGRIYRIKAKGQKLPPLPKLGKASSSDLVKLLEHPNGWHRDTASRLLYQRQDRSIVGRIRKLSATSKLPQGRLHAMYMLNGLNSLRPEDLLPRLTDEDARVREHAIRLSEKLQAHPAIRNTLAQLVTDSDARVRYQLAFSLGSVKGSVATQALTRLALKSAGDSWMRLALLSSMGARRGEVIALLLKSKEFRQSKTGQAFLLTLASQIGSANQSSDVALLLKSLSKIVTSDRSLYQSCLRQFLAGQSPKVRAELSKGTAQIASFLKLQIASARKTALDSKRKPSDRAEAIRTLSLASFSEVEAILKQCLEQSQPQPVQQSALQVASQFSDEEVAPLILDSWKGLSPALRATAAEAIFSRVPWVKALLNAVEAMKIARIDLDPARIQLLSTHPDKSIQARVKKLFTNSISANREKIFQRYRQALSMKGDAEAGLMVFKKNCASCHRLHEVGESVGADLTAIRDRGEESILLNILDPNREVKPAFVSYNVETKKGQLFTGMITAETANSLTLRKPDGKSVTLLRSQLEEIRSTGLSFMPEGLEKEIDLKSMANLLAFLMKNR